MGNYETYEIIRNELKLKNSDVAKRGNIPPSTFTDWKNGKSSPKMEKLQRIANVLNIEYNVLLLTPEEYKDYAPQAKTLEAEIAAIDYLDNSDLDSTKNFLLIVAYLSQLNDEGFNEAIKRIEELTQLDKYKKE